MGLHRSRVVKRPRDIQTETIESPESKRISGDSILPELLSSAHFRRELFAPTLTRSTEPSVAGPARFVDEEMSDESRKRSRRRRPLASKAWGHLPTVARRGVHSGPVEAE